MSNTTFQIVKVGIADMNIVKGQDVIRTSGLGSCVGVIIYDLQQQIAGLAHIMLPNSTLAREERFNTAKYADTATDELISRLLQAGAKRINLKAKIAGGAQMFQFASKNDMMRIGPRNVEAVIERLAYNRISLLAKDVGGSSGRTIEFTPSTGKLTIRTVNQGVHDI
ncbi:chemotaxis protein CheD [Bacillus sp. HMF5848]|uniref:chemotaxis protein CheD n=1 Tax=Bacillus sp. HMF5848 TaxID=2495421 RepID=UPI000F782E6C|nr:chemotaxis protein CheD [Bacillus sp. HMF5848]RSK27050.1 chemotaxis protein CheD [Bacillus sp. HMF5848]